MATSVMVTVRWGEHVLLVEQVFPGKALHIGDGGPIPAFFAIRDCAATPIAIHADGEGATVLISEGVSYRVDNGPARATALPCGSGPARARLMLGATLEAVLTASGVAIDEQHGATWFQPVAVGVTVASHEKPEMHRRRSHSWLGFGASIAAHAAMLGVSAAAMPVLANAAADAASIESLDVRAPLPLLPVTACDRNARHGDMDCSAAQFGQDGDDATGRERAVEGPADNPQPRTAFIRTIDSASFDRFRLPDAVASGASSRPALWGDAWALGTDPVSSGGSQRTEHDARACFGDQPFAPSWQLENASVSTGPIGVQGDPSGWRLAYGVLQRVQRFTMCYGQALTDEVPRGAHNCPSTLEGRLRVALVVRDRSVDVEMRPEAGLRPTDALLCCIVRAHDDLATEMGSGVRGTARYVLTLAGRAERR